MNTSIFFLSRTVCQSRGIKAIDRPNKYAVTERRRKRRITPFFVGRLLTQTCAQKLGHEPETVSTGIK